MDAQPLVPRLTWHPGSIRPYASLWHTVLRVTALNSLRVGDLPNWPTARNPQGRTQHSLYPLYNDSAPVDTHALACSLGESPAIFRWSHFGALAPWLRFIVTPGFRLCLSCLADGYHSALLSLRLLDVCPIHRTPLLTRCHCGRPFADRLSQADFNRAGSCACYQQSFFTRETCRAPTLGITQTQVFDPVIDWLEQMSQLIGPADWRAQARMGEKPAWHSQLYARSESLGLAYPTCFPKPTLSPLRVLTVHASAQLPFSNRAEPNPPMKVPAQSSFWANSPATWTYRAMTRHLRRHVVRRCEYWVSLFDGMNDSELLAALLRTDHNALLAFAEMLWVHSMEPQERNRRRSHRGPWHCTEAPFHGQLAPTTLEPSDDALPGAVNPLNPAARCWIEYHAAGTTMLALWREALDLASRVAHSEIDVSQLAPLDASFLCDWVAVTQPDQRVRFVGLSRKAPCFAMKELADKRARRDTLEKAQADLWHALLDVCSGPCLTWTQSGGWHVTDAARPVAFGWQRHRLLGLKDQKPQFWLFENGERFAARLCMAKLQTFAQTPRGAIEELRRCLPQYMRLFGGALLTASAAKFGPNGTEAGTLCRP